MPIDHGRRTIVKWVMIGGIFLAGFFIFLVLSSIYGV